MAVAPPSPSPSPPPTSPSPSSSPFPSGGGGGARHVLRLGLKRGREWEGGGMGGDLEVGHGVEESF